MEITGSEMVGTQSISDHDFLRTLLETRSFTNGMPQSIQLTPDGRHALFLRSGPRDTELRLYAVDFESGSERELASRESLLGDSGDSLTPEEQARRERMRITASGIVSYQLSSDGHLALFMLGGRAFVIALVGGRAREIAGPDETGAALFDPELSPDGTRCAFVRAGELWVVPVHVEEQRQPGPGAVQLTHGATSTLLHARAEFVAQEEFSRFRGFWWSPDSAALLYEEVDEESVEKLFLQDPAHAFRAPAPQAYPRAGRHNAKCRFGIVPATGGETRWLPLKPHWEYVARVEWAAPEKLLLIALTRDQRDLALISFDAQLRARTLLTEHDEAFLNSARDLLWLPDSSGFLWSSEGAGALQLFHHAADGTLLRELTPLAFRFASIAGFDEATDTLFLLRHPTPLASELWRQRLHDENDTLPASKLAPADGVAESITAVFAQSGRTHLRVCAPLRGGARFELVRQDGTIAGQLRSVAEPMPPAPRIEFAQVGEPPLCADGHRADGGFHSLLVRPRDFVAQGNYPLIVQLYGGPHVNTVRAQSAAYLLDQWIADHGFLVLRVDNRGTPLRGRDWERAIAGKFCEVPLDDQIAALHAWAAREPAIDLTRVGAMGHSFGGYLAALSVLRRPDVFKAAVAGAPVVDWMNYDTGYTERYLGVPPPEGNPLYARNGLLDAASQPTLEHRPLLISHGTADDNVHFSESLLLCDALFRAGKPFELLPQLGQTHQFHEPALLQRYWERVFAFFRTHL